MASDAADRLIKAGKGILNGDNARDAVNEGIRRMQGGQKQQPSQPGKPDPSWHNDMVDKANDSFKHDASSDPKAAVAKMQPAHVHKLVQDAHAGKYGPDAQKVAQSAMQGAPGAPQGTDQPGQTAKPNYAKMFSVTGQEPQEQDDPDQAVPAGQMFSGR